MIEPFLRYSLRWACPVKLVYLLDGQMKSGNATVVFFDGERLDIITARNKKTPQTLPLSAVLAAGYARGDDGDTTKRGRAQNLEDKHEKEAD